MSRLNEPGFLAGWNTERMFELIAPKALESNLLAIFYDSRNSLEQLTKPVPATLFMSHAEANLTCDLLANTWSWESYGYTKRTFALGTQVRVPDSTRNWGPFMVYDCTNQDHLVVLARELENFRLGKYRLRAGTLAA